MDIDVGGGHEAVFVHQADAIIVGGAPYASVGCHGQVEFTCSLKGGFFGECRVAGDVEGNLHAQLISMPIDATVNEIGEFWGFCPLPGSTEQVAISEDEATRDRFKGVNCRICVFDSLQAMRPV